MKLLHLIERNIAERRLSSTLTALGVALGVMLVSAIVQLKAELADSYMRPGRGYALVVGAPGAPLQLVLSAVFHVERVPGLMPLSAYDELADSPAVLSAVPYALGDSYRGFRVVGTTGEFFSASMPHPPGDGGKLAAGRPFRYQRDELDRALAGAEGSGVFEAVVGAEVAGRLGLSVGDSIEPSHGVAGPSEHASEHRWTVVGILRRSDTPVDRLVLINLDSFFRIEDHADGVIADTGERGISAVLVFPRPGMHKGILLSQLRKRSDVMVADVQTQVRRLFDIVGNLDSVFLLVAVLVVIIGVVSIMVAIYNTMSERQVEIATLRAIGAHRRTVFGLVVGEAAMLSAAGALAGILLGHALTLALRGHLAEVAGLDLEPWRLLPAEGLIVVGVVIAGALAGLIPAWKAYRTDVARSLSGRG